MKYSKMLTASLALFTTVSCIGISAYAEETTETVEIAVTEATESITEKPTDSLKWVILDGYENLGEWNGSEDLKGTINIAYFQKDFGAFQGLRDGYGKELDSSCYNALQNGNESFTITLSAEYLMLLSAGTYYFDANFENGSLEPAFVVNVPDMPLKITDNTDLDAVPKTNSPKTGCKGVGVAVLTAAFSSVTAAALRKRK